MASLIGGVGVEVVYRTDSATGSSFWANRYEVFLDEAFDSQVIGAAFEDFSLPLLNSNFWLDHVTVSTLAQDSQPYDVDTLGVWPVNKRGLRLIGIGEKVLPLTNVLLIKKYVTSGRLGNIMLRGYLTEDDIASDGNGGVSLQNIGALQTSVDNAYAALVTSIGGMHMLHEQGAATVVRPVGSLIVAKVTTKSLRTKRKTRLVANAVQDMREVMADGIVQIEDIPQFVQAASTIIRYLSEAPLPPLLP